LIIHLLAGIVYGKFVKFINNVRISADVEDSSAKSTQVFTMQSIIAASLYGILAIIGGIIGYKKAGSKVSLISGTISGLLLLVAAYLEFQGQSWGFTLAVIITSILVIVFAIRFIKTRKLMPAGLMVVLGLVSLGVMLSQLVVGS